MQSPVSLIAAALMAVLCTATSAVEDPEIPAEFKRYWADPVAAFARENSKTRPNYFALTGSIPFPFTSFYTERVKQCVFEWDVTDLGAPRLHPEHPLGRRDLIAQLAGSTTSAPLKLPRETQRLLARDYVQMTFALRVLLQHATLAPGIYTPKNVSNAALRKQMRLAGGALEPLDELNLNEAGGFTFTEKHRLLLKHMTVNWPSKDDAQELLDAGFFPGPSIDLDEPYGITGNLPVAMAMIFKDEVALSQKDGNGGMAEGPRAEYFKLHRQMLFALQVFVENAELKPGSYAWAKP